MSDQRETFRSDDRGVSIAISHVLTLGITTLLITGLLLGASGALERERDTAIRDELRSTGDRIVADMVTAADRGQRTEADVTVRPRYDAEASDGYHVELSDDGECFARSGYDGCLILTAQGEDESIEVPVNVPDDVDIEPGETRHGAIVVEYRDGDPGTITVGER